MNKQKTETRDEKQETKKTNSSIISSRGYVLLFTVLVSSLILSIALGMTSLAYRETSLNIVAKNSQYALFAADSAAECALNHLLRQDSNPFVGWPDGVQISCGGITLVSNNLNGAGNEPNYIFNQEINGSSTGTALPKGCGIPRIYQPSGTEVLRVQGIGYNLTCPALFTLTNPTQRVERAIEYTFLLTGGDGGLGSGNPISGNGILNVSLFDPGSINTDLLGSFNPNQQGGVLGNSNSGGFFATLYDGVLDLFGINNTNQGSTGGIDANQYNGNLDGMINSNGGLNPSDTGKLSSDGQGNLYVNDNGNLGNLGNSGTNLNTDKTGSLGTTTGGIRIISNSPLDQGMIKETNPVDSWFSQFFGNDSGAMMGDPNTSRVTTPSDTKLNTTKTMDGLLTAPDGTLSLAQQPTSRNLEIAQVVIDRYGKAIGDAKLASQINPEILVKVASTMSFPDGPITYDTAKKLIYNYGQAIGNSNFYSQFDYTTLAQVMDNVRLDYSVPNPISQQQIQDSSKGIINSVKTFFYDLLGISTTQKQALLAREIKGVDIAKIVLQQYALQSGSSTVTEKIDPEVLAAIGEKYEIGSNGLTPDVAKEILIKYGETVGDAKIASQIDSDLFAQVVDGVLQKAAILSQNSSKVTRITPEMVKSLGQVYVQEVGDPAGASWIDTNRFTDMLNSSIPTNSIVTPELAQLFLKKYADAVANPKLVGTVAIGPLTDFLNKIVAASGNTTALLAVDKATDTSSKNSDNGAPPEAIQMIFDAYAQAIGNTDVYNAIDPVKFSEITKELPQNDGPVTAEITKMAVEKYATSVGNLKLIEQVDYEVLAKVANSVIDQYEEANTKIADTRIVQPALSITPDIAKKLIEVYAQSFGDKTSLETINPDLLAEAINSSVLVDQPNAEVAKAVLDRYTQLADSKYPDIDAAIFAKYLGGLSPTRLLIQEAPVRYYQTGLGVADIVALPADVSFGTRVKIALASLFGADQTVQKLSIANLSPQVSDIKALQETQTTSSEISTIADVDSISSLASEQMRVLTVRSITEVKRNIIVRFVNMLSFIFGNSRGIVLPIEKAPLIQTAVDTASIEQKQQEVLQLFR